MTFSSKKVLIVEDSLTQARIVANLFERNGMTPDIVHSRHEALSRLRRHRYLLLVLDVFVGVDNMLEHLTEFRQIAPRTPIAVMTAGQRGQPNAVSHALNLARRSQVDFLLPKPFDFNDVRQVCAEADRAQRVKRPLQRVLVVDDDAYTRILMRNMLESDGWHVAESASVEDALMRLDVTRVDAVVMDIVMPGLGGMAGIRIIRSTWPEVPVIATTGYVKNTTHLEDAVGKGAFRALAKPFAKEQLLAAVSESLAAPPGDDDPTLFV